MLTPEDLTYMKDAQDEIYTLRTRPITFIYKQIQRDPVSNVPIGETEGTREIDAVITEMSIKKANGSRFYENGIEFEQGDIKIDVKIDLIKDIVDNVTQAKFDDKDYEILGVDKKGIGLRNRYELLGREIA